MKRWPWISLVAGAVMLLNPVGFGFLRNAFFSGEQLSRNIAQPVAFSLFAAIAAAIALEWWLRRRSS